MSRSKQFIKKFGEASKVTKADIDRLNPKTKWYPPAPGVPGFHADLKNDDGMAQIAVEDGELFLEITFKDGDIIYHVPRKNLKSALDFIDANRDKLTPSYMNSMKNAGEATKVMG